MAPRKDGLFGAPWQSAELEAGIPSWNVFARRTCTVQIIKKLPAPWQSHLKQGDCRVAKRHQSKQQKLRMAPRKDVSVSFLAMM